MGVIEEIRSKEKQKKEFVENPSISESVKNRFRGGKVRVVMHFEDESIDEYYRGLGEGYFFDINEKYYLIQTNCIITGRGGRSEIHYYYNNPCPIKFGFRTTDLNAKEIIKKERLQLIKNTNENVYYILMRTVVDSKALRSAFNSKYLSGMYKQGEEKGFQFDSRILIYGAIAVLVILQVTGVLDLSDIYGQVAGAIN